MLLKPLSEKYHVICVNYTGFDGGTELFDTQTNETERLEKYVSEHFGGNLDAVYGSSMGGSFASLMMQRGNIHMDHVFIGSSDLDQASPFVARLETGIVGAFMKWMVKNPDKAMAKFSKLADAKGMSVDDAAGQTGGGEDYTKHMMEGFVRVLDRTDMRSIKNQFYSDLVTKLDDKISVPGTRIHVFHSEKMGEKYLKRYYKHYADPEIIPFPLGHEGWLGMPDKMIEVFDKRIQGQ